MKDVFSNGKGSLRRNILLYILNCVMQPEQHMRQTAEEVLMTLESWEKELHEVASDELHTARTISVPFIKVCQMYGRRRRKTVDLDLPGANEVLRPPKIQEIAPRTSLRSVPAAMGAPYRVQYARDPGDAQAARRNQGKKVYDKLLFRVQQ